MIFCFAVHAGKQLCFLPGKTRIDEKTSFFSLQGNLRHVWVIKSISKINSRGSLWRILSGRSLTDLSNLNFWHVEFDFSFWKSRIENRNKKFNWGGEKRRAHIPITFLYFFPWRGCWGVWVQGWALYSQSSASQWGLWLISTARVSVPAVTPLAHFPPPLVPRQLSAEPEDPHCCEDPLYSVFKCFNDKKNLKKTPNK